jgi:hypothetical protein
VALKLFLFNKVFSDYWNPIAFFSSAFMTTFVTGLKTAGLEELLNEEGPFTFLFLPIFLLENYTGAFSVIGKKVNIPLSLRPF